MDLSEHPWRIFWNRVFCSIHKGSLEYPWRIFWDMMMVESVTLELRYPHYDLWYSTIGYFGFHDVGVDIPAWCDGRSYILIARKIPGFFFSCLNNRLLRTSKWWSALHILYFGRFFLARCESGAAAFLAFRLRLRVRSWLGLGLRRTSIPSWWGKKCFRPTIGCSSSEIVKYVNSFPLYKPALLSDCKRRLAIAAWFMFVSIFLFTYI